MKFCIYQNSLQGGRRSNQDRIAYSYSKDALLTVLADGMGGYRHGEIAAQIAIATMTNAFQRLALPVLVHPAQFLQEQMLLAHQAIDAHAAEHRLPTPPRTTLVAALAQQDELYVAHAGDSRLYQFREGRVVYRTEDHSKVQLMHRRGLLSLDEMATHPERHKVYSCLGGEELPRIALSEKLDLQQGDTVLLCSDGLWSLVEDEKMAGMVSADTVDNTIPELLELAESRMEAKGDNMSAIAFNWGGMVSVKRFVSTASMPLDSVTTIMLAAQQRGPSDKGMEITEEEERELSDDEIEEAIAEIQAAINRLQK